ncbi:DUF6082 family protein [Actinoplanes sp. CA-131856]
MTNSAGHSGRLALIITSTAAGAALILASPLLLLFLSSAGNFDWVLLGNIGQAYGLASALVSSVALVAVARTLTAQMTQNKVGQSQAFREMQAQVARFSFDFPEDTLGMVGATTKEEFAAAKANIFRTFYARVFCDGLEMGEYTEWDIRNEFAPGLFSTEGGRNWWRWARPGWVDAHIGTSDARLRFGRILDDVFAKRFTDEEFGPSIDMDYEGLAERVLSKGDMYHKKAWMPAGHGRRPTCENSAIKSDNVE